MLNYEVQPVNLFPVIMVEHWRCSLAQDELQMPFLEVRLHVCNIFIEALFCCFQWWLGSRMAESSTHTTSSTGLRRGHRCRCLIAKVPVQTPVIHHSWDVLIYFFDHCWWVAGSCSWTSPLKIQPCVSLGFTPEALCGGWQPHCVIPSYRSRKTAPDFSPFQ